MSVRGHLAYLSCAALIAVGAAAPAAAQAELKAMTTLPTNLVLTKSFTKMIDEANEALKGSVAISFLGGPEVTPPEKAADSLKRGIFQLMHSPASYYTGTVPEADVLIATNRSAAEIRKNGGLALIQKIWAEKLNVHVLGWFESRFQDSADGPHRGLYNLYFTKKPTITADKLDLTGFKMRTTPTYTELLNALGAVPVSIKAGEVYTSLERGIVQGFGFPGVAVIGLGVQKVVKYRVDPAFFTGNNLILVHLPTWNKLPQAARDKLTEMAAKYEVESNLFVTAEARKEEAELKQNGMEILTLTGNAEKNYLSAAYDTVWARVDSRAPENAKLLREKFF